MRKLYLLFAFTCMTITSNAQMYEAGFFVGGSNYIGDIGSENYINPNELMGGIIYKWNANPRMAFRGTFTYAKIAANDADANNLARNNRDISFTNSIKELAVGMEFNFFEYNLEDYRHTQTPYILVEFAAFNYKNVKRELSPQEYEYGSNTSFAIPFGVGYKTKVVGSLAMAIEVKARYTFADDIDYNNAKIASLQFGNPKSNDWYVLSGVSLFYTFGRPPCYVKPH